MQLHHTLTRKDMKDSVTIQCVSLVVASTRPLPVFQTVPVDFSDEFPGIFSIRHIRANLYSVEVSVLSILNVSAALCRLAESQPEPAPSVHHQPSSAL